MQKKNDGQMKKTAKRVTDSTLPCYGAMIGKHNSVWPFKVNPSRYSAYRTDKLTESRCKEEKSRKTSAELHYQKRTVDPSIRTVLCFAAQNSLSVNFINHPILPPPQDKKGVTYMRFYVN